MVQCVKATIMDIPLWHKFSKQSSVIISSSMSPSQKYFNPSPNHAYGQIPVLYYYKFPKKSQTLQQSFFNNMLHEKIYSVNYAVLYFNTMNKATHLMF